MKTTNKIKKEIIKQAQKDFNELVKNSSKKQKKSFLSGYGIWSMYFAKKYVDSLKDNKTYKAIYNIPFRWAENYEKEIKKKIT